MAEMFLLRLFFLLFSLLSCTATVGEAATVEHIYVQCNLSPSLVQCVNIIITIHMHMVSSKFSGWDIMGTKNMPTGGT
jgi:hypothetical protein